MIVLTPMLFQWLVCRSGQYCPPNLSLLFRRMKYCAGQRKNHDAYTLYIPAPYGGRVAGRPGRGLLTLCKAPFLSLTRHLSPRGGKNP